MTERPIILGRILDKPDTLYLKLECMEIINDKCNDLYIYLEPVVENGKPEGVKLWLQYCEDSNCGDRIEIDIEDLYLELDTWLEQHG